jgi:ribosomal protein L11 methyltransferase
LTNYPKRNKLAGSGENPAKFSGNPYQDLYVYCIRGHLTPGTDLFRNDFIGNWQEDEFSFLFFSQPSDRNVQRLLTAQPQLTLLDNFYMTYDDWQGAEFDPIRVGRFLIAPPWAKVWYNTKPNDKILPIKLDPGVVFGSGTHATTCDCLEALELVFGKELPQTAFDLGTGTGLLALAAARLGCKRTIAVDINFLAATTAYRNIRLNYMEDRVVVAQGNAEDIIGFRADLVIANIHYDVMKRLISSDSFYNKKWFILSGLMRDQAAAVAHKLAQRSAGIIKKWTHDDVWHTLFGARWDHIDG